jgi:hypothetical protein
MPSRNRRRRAQAQAVALDRRGRPVTPWKWWTFPVYFALSAGLFVGFELGLYAAHLSAKGSTRLEEFGGLAIAILFSFGMAQVATRPFAEAMFRRRQRQQEQRAKPSDRARQEAPPASGRQDQRLERGEVRR